MNAPDDQSVPLPEHVAQPPSGPNLPANDEAPPTPRIIILDYGRISRLVMVAVWIAFLSFYCLYENRREIDDLAQPRPHSQDLDAAVASGSEVFHVEIAESCNCGKGPEWVRWNVFRLVSGISKPEDALAKLHPEWETLREVGTSKRLQLIPEKYRLSRFTNDGSLTVSPSPMLYGVLALILIAADIVAFVYLIFIYRGLGHQTIPNVTVTLVYLTIVAHIILTYEQGGLLISPVGEIFTTLVAFLSAHAVTIAHKEHRSIRWLYVGAPFILLIGSLFAHQYVTTRYDQGVQLLLAHVYRSEYLSFLIAALVLGILSIWSRKWTGPNQTVEIKIY
jgi:hypothetical protein